MKEHRDMGTKSVGRKRRRSGRPGGCEESGAARRAWSGTKARERAQSSRLLSRSLSRPCRASVASLSLCPSPLTSHPSSCPLPLSPRLRPYLASVCPCRPIRLALLRSPSLSVSPLLLSLGHTFLSVTAAPPSSRCVSGRTANDAFARSRARSSTGDGSFVVAMSRESAIPRDQSTREITADPMPSLVRRVVLSLEGDPPRSLRLTDLRFAQRSGCL